MDPFNKVLEYLGTFYIVKGDELQYKIDFKMNDKSINGTIMDSDFPILKNNGFSFATLFSYKDGTCFVYGHYKRAYAVRQAINNNGRAYCLKDNKKTQRRLIFKE